MVRQVYEPDDRGRSRHRRRQVGKNDRKWPLVNTQVRRPRQSKYESFWTSSRKRDILTSAMRGAQWASPSVRPEAKFTPTKRGPS